VPGSDSRIEKAKAFFSRNKPALALIALFLIGGLAAVTKLLGPPARRERGGSAKGMKMPIWDAKMERWKAPEMQRSDPEAMVRSGGAFGETENAEAPATPKPPRYRPPIVGGSGEAVPQPPEMPREGGGRRPVGRLDKGKGFESSGGGSGGGSGASASASAPNAAGAAGAAGSAGASGAGGGGGAGKGPLSTLRRNIAILAGRASRALGFADTGTSLGKGATGPNIFAAAPNSAISACSNC